MDNFIPPTDNQLQSPTDLPNSIRTKVRSNRRRHTIKIGASALTLILIASALTIPFIQTTSRSTPTTHTQQLASLSINDPMFDSLDQPNTFNRDTIWSANSRITIDTIFNENQPSNPTKEPQNSRP